MTRFPVQTAASILSAALILAAAERFVPGVRGPHAALWTELLDYSIERTPATPAAPPEAEPVPEPPPTPAVQPRFFDESGGALDRFYAALWRAEKREPGAVVRIVHYGDSPTTADLITGDVRDLLQRRFGNAGHGYTLLARPWAWHQRRHIKLSASGWKADPALYFGSKDLRYGLAGVTFSGAGSTRIALERGEDDTFELWFMRRRGAGTALVSADGGEPREIDTAGDAEEPGYAVVPLPEGTHSIEVRTRGAVLLFGGVLERRGPGVVYDSLGLNGGSVTVLSRVFSERHWAEQLQHRRPDLVVLNYGANEASFPAYVDGPYEKDLREAIRRVRKALPETPVLVMAPMDRAQRAGSAIATMPAIPRVAALQRRVAADTGCAFFDTFHAMGGEGTMARWYDAKPRLVSADFLHPTPQGGKIVAELLVGELTRGLDRWKAARLRAR